MQSNLLIDPPHVDGPSDLERACQAIDIALRLGDPAAAQQSAVLLLSRYPAAVLLLVLLGFSLLEQGQPEAAIERFRHALRLHPLDASAWAGLAGALAALGHRRTADTALRRAALYDPLGSDALTPGVAEGAAALGAGIAYLRQGHAALAAAELAVTVEQHPDRDDLRLHYVEALRRCGHLALARRQLAIVMRPVPTLPVLLLRAALDLPVASVDHLRMAIARYDPTGQLARRFFAPEVPPWPLPVAPVLADPAELSMLAAYLPALSRTHHDPVKSSLVAHRAVHDQPDGDVQQMLATTRRLHTTLSLPRGAGGPAVAAAEREGPRIILSCRAALLRRYGDVGFAAIDRRLRDLVAAFEHAGARTFCSYIDDAESLRLADGLAFAPVDQRPEAIETLVRTMAQELGYEAHHPPTLLLVGGHEIVPLHHLDNPMPDDDDSVPSDNPYASDDAGYILPQRIVARLPTDAQPQPSLLLRLLDRMIDHHANPSTRRQGGLAALPLFRSRQQAGRRNQVPAFAYSAEVWQDASRAVLDALNRHAALTTCPPEGAETLDIERSLDHHLLYLNLHGAAGLPNWYGQPRSSGADAAAHLPVALRPDQLAHLSLAGTLLVSEACYGMDLNDRTPASSIPLRALAEGVLACVGATVNAYGSTEEPLVGADLLCALLFERLAQGLPIGVALHQARIEFARAMYRRQGYLDDVDIKTLTEFVLLGDPWARASLQRAPESAWPTSKVVAMERVPKPRQRIALIEEQVPRAMVNKARGLLRSLLPTAPAAPLQITAHENPRFSRKGEPETDLVFSAYGQRLTVDGHQTTQMAQVTLRGQAVVKVAITR